MSDPIRMEGIAVVGMAGRFPKARTVEEFWTNLAEGRDCFSRFSVDDVVSAGVPKNIAASAHYVRRSPVVDDPASFDTHAFGYSPREAELIDPQQRLMLECSWEALERAGHDPHRFTGAIGIWAGCGVSNYFLKNLLSLPDYFEALSNFNTIIGNDKDYLASRIAYKLDLRGPAVTVQTACSTSLVAVHMACQALLTYQCDMALAGGVSLQFPRAPGYLYNEGEIFSPDGYCRTFDRKANGTVLGEGCGVVVLRRLEEAVASGDIIHAVIRGSAVNNDGVNRVGFTAPSVGGQSEVIAMAHAAAGVRAADISYVEAHGTGTALGDPIEVSALTRAFRQSTQERGFCGLGSVKTNIGHLDVAAGIAGLIKTVCALEKKRLPATLHYTEPNPELNLSQSPFFIVNTAMEWVPKTGIRIAGISSFGLGGTNAHVIVQEFAGETRKTERKTGWWILPVSASTETAVDRECRDLAEHVRAAESDIGLPDLSYTLAVGKQVLRHRRCIVAGTTGEAADRLEQPDQLYHADGIAVRHEAPIVFAYSGQGTQYRRMASGLYQGSPVFRKSFDECCGMLGPVGGKDSLLDIVFAAGDADDPVLARTEISQPALFAVEYSMARLWESLGVVPAAVIGHSSGEYAAACEAGIMGLEEALALVRERGRLMQSMEAGSMIAVPLSEDALRDILPPTLDIAVINGPTICEVSGPQDEMERLTRVLRDRDVPFRRLHTSHGFHSRMMEGASGILREKTGNMRFAPPRIPMLSNLTGTWMENGRPPAADYWSSHLRNTVRFGDNLTALARKFEYAILLEVGPGNTICSIARQHPGSSQGLRTVPSIRHPLQKIDDMAFLARAFGALWCNGAAVDLAAAHESGARKRILLPTYPFERAVLCISPAVNGVKTRQRDPGKSRKRTDDAPVNRRRPAKVQITLDALIGLWKKVLGIDRIDPDDNFFDLGGHSLLAISLANRIERTFGRKLPISALLNSPTPRQNFALLCESSPGGKTPLCVPIMTGGAKKPVFLFHSHGGNVLEYYRLATLLGDQRPVYALQCQGVDGSPLSPASIEEMTGIYLKEILSIQPQGPYYLGGYCFGGILALEAAGQLKAAGQRTAMVFMINSVTKEYMADRIPSSSRLRDALGAISDRMALEWTNLRGKTARERLKQIAKRVGRALSLSSVRMEKALDALLGMLGRGVGRHSLAYNLERLADNNDAAWLRYQPRQYADRVVFFSAARQPRGIRPDSMLGWKALLTGKVSAHSIEGFRQTLLDDPAVLRIAQILLADESLDAE